MRLRIAHCLILLLCLCRVNARAQQWVEVRSGHLSVVTDSTEEKAREAAEQFERMRAVFGVLFRRDKVNVPVPVTMITFRNRYDFLGTAPLWDAKPRDLQGFFGATEDSDFLTADLLSIEGWRPLLHEATHFFITRNLPPAPLWFEEGVAVYCSGLKPEGNGVVLGQPSNWILQVLKKRTWMPMSALLRVGRDSPVYNENDSAAMFYAQAWLTVQYLIMRNQRDRLTLYLQLTGERNMPVEEAVQEAFGMDVAHFDEAVRDYFGAAKMTYLHVPAPAPAANGPYRVRQLDELGWQSVLAELHYWNKDRREKAVAEFRRILALRPDDVVANRTMGLEYLRQDRFDKAAELLARAATTAPEDSRVHFFLALLRYRRGLSGEHKSDDLAVMKRELEAAIALDADYAGAYNLLAYVEWAGGNLEKARAAVQKAVALDAGNEAYLISQADYELEAHAWEPAEALLNRLKKSRIPEIAREAERKLERMSELRRAPDVATAAPIGDTTRAQWKSKDADRAEASNEQEENQAPPAEPPPEMRSIRFLKGKVVSVDCSAPPGAVLKVVSGKQTMEMFTRDTATLLLIGVEKFSCAWMDRKVSVNYRLKADGRGELVSLEVD